MVDIWWFQQLIASIMFLFGMSFFFKRTILFRISMATCVGVAAGVVAALSMDTIRHLAVIPMLNGEYAWIIPLVLGIAFLTRFTRRFYYFSRPPTAIAVATGLAVATYGQVSNIIRQSSATMASVITPELVTNLSNSLVSILTICTVYYFFWHSSSRLGRFTGWKAWIIRLGRIAIMVPLGVNFAGSTVSWTNVLFDRVNLLMQFLGISKF